MDYTFLIYKSGKKKSISKPFEEAIKIFDSPDFKTQNNSESPLDLDLLVDDEIIGIIIHPINQMRKELEFEPSTRNEYINLRQVEKYHLITSIKMIEFIYNINIWTAEGEDDDNYPDSTIKVDACFCFKSKGRTLRLRTWKTWLVNGYDISKDEVVEFTLETDSYSAISDFLEEFENAEDLIRSREKQQLSL